MGKSKKANCGKKTPMKDDSNKNHDSDTDTDYEEEVSLDYVSDEVDELYRNQINVSFEDNISINDIIQKKVSKNIRNLKEYLGSNNFITEKGDQNTNIISVSDRKTYYIPENYIETFFTLLEECRKESRMLHYSERQETKNKQLTGIMIDFDRIQKTQQSQFTDRHFELLSRNISKLLIEFLDFSNLSNMFIFRIFFIKKPKVMFQNNGLYKDGFHVLIPEIQVSKGLKKFLIQELISRGIIASIFKDIDHLEDPNKMLDKMSPSVPVYFMGNSKIDKPCYNLTHVYEITYLIDDDDIDRKLLDVEQINNCKQPNNTSINLSYELSLTFYTPFIGNSQTWLNKTEFNYKSQLETKIQIIVEKTSRDILDEEDIIDCDNSIDIMTLGNAEANYMKKLLEIIDISYATEYEKWFKVVCAIAHTNVNYKDLAIWFSHRKPESWSQAEINRIWDEATNGRFNKNPITKRSIVYWARESSPEKFLEIDKEHYFQVLARATYENEGRVEHAMAAKICHTMLGNKFLVDVGLNEKNGKVGYCWFEFVSPGQKMKKGEVYKWRLEMEPDNIHIFISQHLPKVYLDLALNIKDRKDNAKNEGEAKYWANVEKTFRLYISKLSNDTFQNGIIRQAQYLFRDRGFCEELDTYSDVIGVGNGVLKIGIEPKLIKGFHEYKISKYTETDYIPYNKNNPQVKVLLNAIRDIFLEKDVFKFMLYHASTGLDANESACLLLLLVGGGQNGKTFFAKMVHNTLGNMYCASGKSALLTASIEKAENANSAQMQMRNRRYFYFDEFNNAEILNTGRVKAMVNPGWQSGRDLHQKQTNFKNTCNPVALSNFDFIINTTDHGTWRRIYYYKNKVKFCNHPSPNNRYEKKVDSRFIDEFANDPIYRQAMLSILVHYYSKLCIKYKGDIKNIPVPTIHYETEMFRNRQDTINRFITEMIVESPHAEELGIPTIASKYSEWFGIHYKRGILPPGIEIQAQLENSKLAPLLTMGAGNKLCLTGHRLKTTSDEKIDEDEREIKQRVIKPVYSDEKSKSKIKIEKNKSKYSKDDDINMLITCAPTHIQQAEKYDEDKEINDFLSTLD